MESSSDPLKRRRYYLRVTAAIDQPPRFCGPYFLLASPLWVFSPVAFHAVIQQPRLLPSCGSAIFSGLGGFHLQLVIGRELRIDLCVGSFYEADLEVMTITSASTQALLATALCRGGWKM